MNSNDRKFNLEDERDNQTERVGNSRDTDVEITIPEMQPAESQRFDFLMKRNLKVKTELIEAGKTIEKIRSMKVKSYTPMEEEESKEIQEANIILKNQWDQMIILNKKLQNQRKEYDYFT